MAGTVNMIHIPLAQLEADEKIAFENATRTKRKRIKRFRNWRCRRIVSFTHESLKFVEHFSWINGLRIFSNQMR